MTVKDAIDKGSQLKTCLPMLRGQRQIAALVLPKDVSADDG